MAKFPRILDTKESLQRALELANSLTGAYSPAEDDIRDLEHKWMDLHRFKTPPKVMMEIRYMINRAQLEPNGDLAAAFHFAARELIDETFAIIWKGLYESGKSW